MMLLIHTVVTWLGLCSLALAIAILTFRLPAFASPVYGQYGTEPDDPSIRPFFAVLIVVIAAASVGDLLLRTSEMTGRTIFDGLPLLQVVVQRTHYGKVWLVRMAALALLILLMLFPEKCRTLTIVRVTMLALAAAIAWTYSASGHPSDQGDFTIREMADLLHLVAASLWGGGVLALALVILPPLLSKGDLLTIAEVARRFSRMAGFAVLVLLLTALYNVRVYAGEFKALWTTGYGLTVTAKIILLYFLLLIGAFNRYIGVPLLLHVAGGRLEPPGAIGRVVGILLDRFRRHLTAPVTLVFRKALLVEAALMAAVLLCAAGLKHQTPASHIRHGEQQHIEVTTLTVETQQGRPLTDQDRAPWLQAFADLIAALAENSRSGVIACSALKQAYSKKLVESATDVRHVYLKGGLDQIRGRVQARQSHFLKAALLESQFDILEEPREAVVIDISEDPAAVVQRIWQGLGLQE